MKKNTITWLAGLLLLTGGALPALAGSIKGINHTKWAINHFSVNGQSAIDAIGPFQGGGGGGSYSAPSQWKPGLTVRVDWEAGVAFASDVPDIPKPKQPISQGQSRETWQQEWRVYHKKRQEWRQKIKTLNKQHSQIVPLPAYLSGETTCGITVHFMPCDQIKVTTSCAAYDNPRYPIKEPIQMKEPAVCPR